jgi:hypothetical protein
MRVTGPGNLRPKRNSFIARFALGGIGVSATEGSGIERVLGGRHLRGSRQASSVLMGVLAWG